MKKLLAGLLLMFFMLGCKGVKEEKKAGVTGMLPANTWVLIKAKSLRDNYENLGLTAEKFFGEPVSEMGRELVFEIGINLFDLKEMENAGLDTGGEFVVFSTHLESGRMNMNGNLGFALPVKDGKKAISNLEEKFQKRFSRFKRSENEKGVTYSTEKEIILLFLKENYLFFIGGNNRHPEIARDVILKGENTLTRSEKYLEVARRENVNEDIFAYGDLQNLIQANWEILQGFFLSGSQQEKLEYLKDYRAMGVTLNTKSPDLKTRFALTLREGSPLLEMYQDVQKKRDEVLSIDRPLAFLFSMAFNMDQYIKFYKKNSDPALNQYLAQIGEGISRALGMDPAMLLKQLSGSMNLAFYDGKTINIKNYNALISLGVKNREETQKMVDQALERLSKGNPGMVIKYPDYDQINIMGFVQIYVAVNDKNLILTSERDILQGTLEGKGKGGTLAYIKDPALTKNLRESDQVFYLNVDEIFAAVKNFAMFLKRFAQRDIITPKVEETVALFHYFLVHADVMENRMEGEMILKTRFDKPFFKKLSDMSGQ